MAMLKIKQAEIKTIIFDFDGTLARLNIDFHKMRETVVELILSYGITKDKLHEGFILEMINGTFEFLSQRSHQDAWRFFAEANALIEDIEIEAAGHGELFGHTKELLTSLQSKNISYGIITRNCAKAINIIFPDILSYCPVIVCRDDVSKVKPHPEHINMALCKLGSQAHHSLMIGDHPIDIMTGHNAGTMTCGVLTGRCQKNDFIEAGADLILSHAGEILMMMT